MDDTSLSIRGEEGPVAATVATLSRFSIASSLMGNEEKSSAYLWLPNGGPRPPWTQQYRWQWAAAGDISKLLGAPFSLTLTGEDANQFLMAKIDRKLLYWIKTRVNLVGQEVIANTMLISTCLYFLAICSGTKVGKTRITGKIRNFYWSSTPHTTRVRVAWQTCCLWRHEGALNFIDPGAAVVALMSKWILSACEPRASNFKTILRYRFSFF